MNDFYCRLGDTVARIRVVPQSELPTSSHLGLSDAPGSDAGIPEIWISDSVSGEVLLGVLLHESLHVALPFLTEETVEQLGSQLAQVATLAGFRKDS